MISHSAKMLDDGGVIVTGQNFRGKNVELLIDCTADQYLKGMQDYKKGALMQDAFPFLNDDEREFLMTGLTSKEFDKIFAEHEEQE